MSKEELLSPRWKVIALYPGCFWKIGDVFNYVDHNCFKTESQPSIPMHGSVFTEHPHLFKKLEWWEERKLDEMPEYLQSQSADFVFKKGDIVKVDKWLESFGPTLRFYSSHTDKITLHPHLYIPATITEYEQYINQQPQTNEHSS